jgi:hypothetical protein
MFTAIAEYSVNPSEAARILNRNCFDRQRPLRKPDVRFYAEEMVRGEWLPRSVLKFCDVNGSQYLIDGQHRLTAIIESQTKQVFEIQVLNADSEEEMARIYTKVDQNAIRTDGNKLKALGLDSEMGMSAPKLERYGAAVKFIESGFVHAAKMHTYEYVACIRKWSDGIANYDDMLIDVAQSGNHIARRSSVAGVGIVTMQESVKEYGESVVYEFWEGVLSGIGFQSQDDPRKRVYMHLLQASLVGGSAATFKSDTHTSKEYQARAVAAGFNAWVENRSLSKLVVVDARSPMRLNGSRFKGK